MSSARLPRAAAIGLALLASARPCFAEPEPAYDLVSYEAHGECPDRAAFIGLVAGQIAEFRDELASASRARVRVALGRSGELVLASFELERADGTSRRRELRSASCEEAAPALAFVLALALGGRGEETPPTASIASTAPQRAAQPEAAPVSATREPPQKDVAPSLPRRPVAAAWSYGAGVELGARTGLGPLWTLVEGGFLELRRSRQGRTFGLRATFLRGEPILRLDRAGSTEFSWWAARLELCPLEASPLPGLVLVPCLGTHLGQLTATGAPEPLPGALGRSAAELWADAVAALRLELHFLRYLSLQAEADLVLPLTTYRFAFDGPDTPVYEVPSLAAAAFLGLGARFP